MPADCPTDFSSVKSASLLLTQLQISVANHHTASKQHHWQFIQCLQREIQWQTKGETVISDCIVYWYSAECTGAVQTVLVLCRVYLYSAECTGTVQSVLVQCRVDWYSAGCTGTVQVHCQSYQFTAFGTVAAFGGNLLFTAFSAFGGGQFTSKTALIYRENSFLVQFTGKNP